jgi:pyrroline-5-carboxylate reductase
VHHAASAYALGSAATGADASLVERLFGAVGVVCCVKEALLDAVTGLSGSGPAYGFLFIEALADGGVLMGLPREMALRLAAQTLSGAAEMVLQTGQHPAVLRDQVASPGGTTIAGVEALELGGVRAGIIQAVRAAAERSEEMGRGRA